MELDIETTEVMDLEMTNSITPTNLRHGHQGRCSMQLVEIQTMSWSSFMYFLAFRSLFAYSLVIFDDVWRCLEMFAICARTRTSTDNNRQQHRGNSTF